MKVGILELELSLVLSRYAGEGIRFRKNGWWRYRHRQEPGRSVGGGHLVKLLLRRLCRLLSSLLLLLLRLVVGVVVVLLLLLEL